MQPKKICLFGESPLLREYAGLCLEKGFEVAIRLNPDQERIPSRDLRGAKRVRHPWKQCDLALELTLLSRSAKKRNLQELDEELPAGTPILSSSVTVTLAEQRRWVDHPERLAGIGAVPTLLEGSVIECVSIGEDGSTASNAAIMFAKALGKESVFVHDSAGLVFPRILSMLANEAMFAVTENVAPPGAIDAAVELGTSYPHGPLAWAERIGRRYIRAIMVAMGREHGEEQYRLAPLLRETAAS